MKPPAALYGLLAAPAVVGIAAAISPRLAMAEGGASAVCYGAGAASGLFAIALAAPASLAPRAAAALAVAGAAMVGMAFALGPSPAIGAALVDLGLVCAAHAIGGSIGRRVAHPGHLLPACAVAAAADLASVLHPAGPSHAIARSDAALSLLAIAFPVPGTRAVAPVLGVGDLIFLALVLGAAAQHRVSLARVAAAGAAGLAAAGVLAAELHREVPALVPIGAAIVLGVPAARRLRREDRRTSAIAIAAAAALVLGVLASPR